MILADTSIWIDHLRKDDPGLANILVDGRIVCHPFIIGEIALGSLKGRNVVLSLLDDLPSLPVATPSEMLLLIETRGLYNRGIGYVDVSLVASCLLTPGTHLWTRDRRLATVVSELGIEGG